MNIELLENYDFVYDMKVNQGHTDITLANLFNISRSTLQRRTSKHKIPQINPKLNLELLEDYDYVYDMKANHNHTSESLGKLFGVSEATVKRRISKHKINTVGSHKTLRLDKLDTTKSILEYSINTITKSEELSKRLKDETSTLDVYPDVMNRHRYYFLKNNLTEIPKCKRCSNITSLNMHTHSKVFYQFCSHLCNSKQSYIDPQINQLLTKEWLYQKRIVENLSFESIAELVGVSYQVITKRLKDFNIDTTPRDWTFNRTQENIKFITDNRTKSVLFKYYGDELYNKLQDRDYFVEEYITKRKSALKISKQLGICDNTVRSILSNFGIGDFNRRYFNSVSDEELDLYEFIKKHKPSAISGYRIVYKSLELDVYIPELNLGFEYNGCYPHSEARKSKTYHESKVEYFNNKGIRVVQIWSDDWIFHNEKVKNMILTRLGVIKKTIHARKCYIKEINHQDYINFLIKNHSLSGNNCSIRYGMFYNDGLVSVMGFKKTAKNISKVGYDLVRFSTLDVHGSFSKLLKHFRSLYPNDVIYSIADLEIVDKNNNVYLSNGFVYDYKIPVDYQYYNQKTKMRENKFKWRKKEFTKLGLDITNKTERELALEYKLLRCYDSGKIMYKLLP